MGWFNNDSEQARAYDEVSGSPHKASLSHELIAGAAAYEAAKAYENHISEEGKPASHEKAKEIFAGFAGAFADRIIETKGLDEYDHIKNHRENIKNQASEHWKEEYYQ